MEQIFVICQYIHCADSPGPDILFLQNPRNLAQLLSGFKRRQKLAFGISMPGDLIFK